MANQKIIYDIDFNTNNSELKNIKTELQKIQNMSLKDFKVIQADATLKELNEIKASAKSLGDALEDSFNPKLGTINIDKFNQNLKKLDLKTIENNFQRLGTTGTTAFRNMAAEVLTANGNIKQTSKLLDSMGKTLTNTIKWSIASSALNTFTGSIRNAWSYVQKLDSSLNDIRIVTGKSADEMERFAKSANRTAKSLGAATTNYTNAALIYYQQGLDEKDVAARSNVTVKAANVTGQSASEVSEQLTAVWNGYKVVAEEAELYVDKLAAVAATTAADLEELSTGMSKVASAAHTMGVDVDQLSAQLATIVSVTRQDAAVVGTALKTIYARMGDLKVDGVDEFGTSLGDVSSQMKQMGIDVLDETGNLRDMGAVIEEVAAKWGTWTDAQQQAAAVAIAGKRQYNNLIALFENWDMYESSKSTSGGAAGTLQEQQDIYMDSLKAHMKGLSTASEELWSSLIDTEGTKTLIDILAKVIEAFADISEGIGGLGPILLHVGGLLSKAFNAQIVDSIGRAAHNAKLLFGAFSNKKIKTEIQQQFGNKNFNDSALDAMVKAREEELQLSRYLTDEQKEQYELYIKQKAELENQRDIAKETLQLNQNKAQEFFDSSENITEDNLLDELKSKKMGYQTAWKSISSSKQNSDVMDYMSDDIGNQSTELDNWIKDLHEYQAELGESLYDIGAISSTELKDYQRYIQTLDEENENIMNSIGGIIQVKEFEEQVFKRVGNSNSKAYKDLELAQKKFYNGSIDATQYIVQMKDAFSDAGAEVQHLISGIESGTIQIDQLGNQIQETDNQFNQFSQDTKKGLIINGLVDIASNLMSVAGACSTLSNVFSILQDDSVSMEDKVTQSISGISSAILSMIPAVVSSLSMLKNSATAALGWIGLILMAVEVIAMGISAIVKANQNKMTELEKANKAFEDAKKSAQAAREELAKLRDEYSNLINTIKDYGDAKLAIDQMRVGTEEWKQAVEELNYQILDLIETYPELKSALMSEEVAGLTVLGLDQDLVNEAMRSRREAIRNQQAAITYRDYNEKKAELNKNRANFGNQINTIAEAAADKIGDVLTDKDTQAFAAQWTDNGKNIQINANRESAAEIYEQVFKTKGTSINNNTLQWSLGEDIYKNLIGEHTIEELVELENTIAESDSLQEEEKDALLVLTDKLKEHGKIIDKNTKAVDSVEKEMLKAIGDKLGVSGEIYSQLASTGDDFNVDENNRFANQDNVKYKSGEESFGLYSTKNKNKLFKVSLTDEGKLDLDGSKAKIDDEDINKITGKIKGNKDISKVQETIDNWVAAAFGEEASVDDYGSLNGLQLADLPSHKIVVDGQEYTLQQISDKIQDRAIEQYIEEYNKALENALKARKDAGQMQEAVLFEDAYYNQDDFSWDAATLSKYNTIISYGGDAANNASIERNKLIAEEKEYLRSAGISANVDKFKELTGEQVKNLSASVIQADMAGANGAISKLIDSANAAQIPKIAEALSKVTDWTDPEQIANFRIALNDIGIAIEDDSSAWNKWMNSLNSGLKQWLRDSKTLEEKLIVIRDLLSNLTVGQLISDEEYNQIISMAPQLANQFIKTVGGYIALEGGQSMAQVALSQFKDLPQIQEYYKNVSIAVENANSAGWVGTAGLSETINTQETLISYFNSLTTEQRRGFRSILEQMGIDPKLVNSTVSTLRDPNSSETERLAAEDQLRGWILAANQTSIDVNEGQMTPEQAKRDFITAIADSWQDIVDAGLGADREALAYWKNKIQAELEAGNWGESLGMDELLSFQEQYRQRELDYFKQVNYELEQLEIQTNHTIGATRVAIMQQQIQSQKDYATIAENRSAAYESQFNTVLKGSNYKSQITDEDGNLDLNKLYNLYGELDPVKDEAAIKELNFILDSYDLWQEGLNQASDALYAVIDSQIEQNRYLYEIQKNSFDIKQDIIDFQQKFSGWTDTIASAFETSVGQTIDNAKQNWQIAYERYNELISPKLEELVGAMQTDYQDLTNQYQESTYLFNNELKSIDEKYAPQIQAAEKNAQEAEIKWKNALENKQSAGERYRLAEEKYRQRTASKTDLEKAAYNTIITEGFQREIDASTDEAYKEALRSMKGEILPLWESIFDTHLKENITLEQAIQKSNAADYGYQNIFNDMINSEEFNKIFNSYGYIGEPEEIEKEYFAAKQQYKDASDAFDEINTNLQETSAETAAIVSQLKENRQSEIDLLNQKSIASVSEIQELIGPYGTLNEKTGEITVDYEALFQDNQQAFEDAFSTLEQMQAALTEMYEAFFTAQDQLVKLFDREIDKLSTINNVLSSSANLWKLIGKNAGNYYSSLNGYYNKVTQNTEQTYQLALKKLKAVQEEYNKIMALGDEATQEMIDAVTENLKAAMEALTQAAQERLDAIIEEFNTKLDGAINSFIKKSTGLDLTGITEAWEQAMKTDEDFLDDVNATYAIEKLTRDVQESIDNTDSVSAQKKLNDVLQEQLKILKEKDKLSQYDIDRANSMYELTLKQIALEEAQQTMSKMKLTRDAMGNYTYQYIADEDNIAKAEAELAAAQNELYNADKERNQSLVEEYYSAMTEAKDKINEAFEEGDINRANRLKEYYFGEGGLLQSLQTELGYAAENLDSIGESIMGASWNSTLRDFTDVIRGDDITSLNTSLSSVISTSAAAWKSASADISALLSKGSPLITAMTSLQNSITDDATLEDKVAELQENSTKLITALVGENGEGGLIKQTADLAASLSTYASTYQTWLNNQLTDVQAVNTTLGLTNGKLDLLNGYLERLLMSSAHSIGPRNYDAFVTQALFE